MTRREMVQRVDASNVSTLLPRYETPIPKINQGYNASGIKLLTFVTLA